MKEIAPTSDAEHGVCTFRSPSCAECSLGALGRVGNDNDNDSRYSVGADTGSSLAALSTLCVSTHLIFLIPRKGVLL